MFCWSSNDKKRESDNLLTKTEPPTVPVLMEVVSASGLVPLKEKPNLFSSLALKKVTAEQLQEEAEKAASDLDPYCIVRLGSKQCVHRTKTIWNDPDPVWTVKTDSLCILNVPEESHDEDVCDETEQHLESLVVVEVCHGHQCLGVVTIPYRHVLEAKGEREEHPIGIDCAPCEKENEEKEDRVGPAHYFFMQSTPKKMVTC